MKLQKWNCELVAKMVCKEKNCKINFEKITKILQNGVAKQMELKKMKLKMELLNCNHGVAKELEIWELQNYSCTKRVTTPFLTCFCNPIFQLNLQLNFCKTMLPETLCPTFKNPSYPIFSTLLIHLFYKSKQIILSIYCCTGFSNKKIRLQFLLSPDLLILD